MSPSRGATGLTYRLRNTARYLAWFRNTTGVAGAQVGERAGATSHSESIKYSRDLFQTTTSKTVSPMPCCFQAGLHEPGVPR